ncbi:F-box family protein [Raphanus sativus]|uniref:F-box protein At3g28330-like n=1 Tax=Raphanus sativus TaxID=3726 RepID=A0A6J0L3A7_RAPSA|nr:F-box protein At3g28330-like [Raphanus sativus]KAJ4877793.1 F-box family protein [Raphanus sativus]
MEYLTEDLWTMVLARLPIKIFTCFKLVCKQWKSIVESTFFRDLFIFVHRSSPSSSSWSVMCIYCSITPEMVGHYQCDTWGLKRSLGSFIESFLTEKNQKRIYGRAKLEAYSDVGLILIHKESTFTEKRVLYVANPVSRECVEIILDALPIEFETNESRWEWGLVTRAENGHLSGYKVVSFEMYKWGHERLSCLIYSSETGLWTLETVHLPDPFFYDFLGYPISLNGNLHWIDRNNDDQEVVLSIDFYASSTTGPDQCRVTPFPDLEKIRKFTRTCTPCQGFLMYMNIVDGSNLCLWRLQSEGWQLISEISPGFTLTGLDYLPLVINPLDAKTAYFWSKKQQRLLSINLHNGKFVFHRQCEGRSDGPIMIPVNDPEAMISLNRWIENPFIIRRTHYFIPFVLPQWLHRIPNTVSIKEPTTTATLR